MLAIARKRFLIAAKTRKPADGEVFVLQITINGFYVHTISIIFCIIHACPKRNGGLSLP